MTTFLIILGVLAALAGAAYAFKRYGGVTQQRDDLKQVVKDVMEKKEVVDAINSLSDDDLRKRWLASVRKRD